MIRWQQRWAGSWEGVSGERIIASVGRHADTGAINWSVTGLAAPLGVVTKGLAPSEDAAKTAADACWRSMIAAYGLRGPGDAPPDSLDAQRFFALFERVRGWYVASVRVAGRRTPFGSAYRYIEEDALADALEDAGADLEALKGERKSLSEERKRVSANERS